MKGLSDNTYKQKDIHTCFYKGEVDDVLWLKCEEFSTLWYETSKHILSKRGQFSRESAIFQNTCGKYGEVKLHDFLKTIDSEIEEPSFVLHLTESQNKMKSNHINRLKKFKEGFKGTPKEFKHSFGISKKTKSFDADLPSKRYNYHVKLQYLQSLREHGVSYVFEKKDLCLTETSDKDVFCFCSLDEESKVFSFKFAVAGKNIHSLLDSMKNPALTSKAAIYLDNPVRKSIVDLKDKGELDGYYDGNNIGEFVLKV